MTGRGEMGHDFESEYRAVLHRSETATAMLRNLEDRRKRRLSHLIATSLLPATKAEHAARATEEIERLDDLIADARIEAGDAGAEATWYAAKLDIWRTRQSTYREHLKRDHDKRAQEHEQR